MSGDIYHGIDHEYDLRLGLRLIYRDVYGHYPNFDVYTMNIHDVNERYNDCWAQYKTKVVEEALHESR